MKNLESISKMFSPPLLPSDSLKGEPPAAVLSADSPLGVRGKQWEKNEPGTFLRAVLIVLITLLPFYLSAQQPRGERAEKVEALKIGFITERLDLTPDEAKSFWPVYNKFQDELEKVRKQRRESLRNPKENFEDMSDSEIEKMVDAEIVLRQNELDIFKKYHPQFKQVLPIRKVALLYKTEEDFKRKLLEIIRERKGDKRQP